MKHLIIAGMALTFQQITLAQDTIPPENAPGKIQQAVEKQAAPQKIETRKQLNLSADVEAYYSYDFNKPASNDRPSFIYNFDRHDENSLNLGFVEAAYADERTRANLAIAAGTYVNASC